MKKETKKEFKVGDYVQVANVGTAIIVSFKNPIFLVEIVVNKKLAEKTKNELSHIPFEKLERDLKFFAECERRGLPIPQTETHLHNPFFDPTPLFNKKTGKKVIPHNTPKRHDYFWSEKKVSLEIDGGTFGKTSGHNTGIGINKGMDKTNWCAYYGIRLLRFKPQDLFSELLFKHLTHLLLK